MKKLQTLCDYADMRKPLIEKGIELDDRLKRMDRKSNTPPHDPLLPEPPYSQMRGTQ
jgi:hypothetical protein